MLFDRETAETIAPVLTMIGQQSRIDAGWTCQMVEAVASQVLPDFYRENRRSAASEAERIHFDVKLALTSGARTEDVVRLAQTCADAEQLDDALYWIGKAVQARPEEGEYLRFKASILERQRHFEKALRSAQDAARLGAHPDAIQSDIARIENGWLAQLQESACSSDPGTSLQGYLNLYQHGRIKAADLVRIFLQIIRLCAQGLLGPKRNQEQPTLN